MCINIVLGMRETGKHAGGGRETTMQFHVAYNIGDWVEILEGSALRDTLFTCQNLPICEQASRVKTYPFVNGFRLVNINTCLRPG